MRLCISTNFLYYFIVRLTGSDSHLDRDDILSEAQKITVASKLSANQDGSESAT